MKRPLFLILILITGLLSGCTPSGTERPRNIILFIGDGMGVSHITAGKTVLGKTHLERFAEVGLVTTHSADAYVTDSAAGATALATGRKTRNGMISCAPDSLPLKTVLEYAEEAGYTTGLISTSAVTHATPAGFAAHVPKRNMYNEIANQIAVSGVDVLFGGGYGYFIPGSQDHSYRKDNRNLIADMAVDHHVIWTPAGLDSLDDSRGAVGLFTAGHPPAIPERSFSLARLTKSAIDILSKGKQGFFLMVEGSQIDWAAHDNDSDGIIAEFIDFDDAVGTALDWAEQDGETLIIVTADHETGGYAVQKGSIAERTVTGAAFTTDGHTGAMVPIFAAGPAAALFSGIIDNTDIGSALISLVAR